MYSVIIQNQKTMEAFSRYEPLFTEAIKNNRIGICKWIESGTTIDTALPELSSLTDDKDEWRAVIIRYEDDDSMALFESDPVNPFDFLINKNSVEQVEESPIPLVRLAQMLGGVPAAEIQFTAQLLYEEHKAPRTVYIPVKDEKQEEEYKRLTEKYGFNGKLPAAILLISVRDGQLRNDNIRQLMQPHQESDSSEFWRRNRFPAMCRFMVFDFAKQGPIQREADDFRFWYAVMLMSINEWDSSTVQAYRLYMLSVDMDKNAMAEAFQVLVNRVRDIRSSLEKSIKREVERPVGEEGNLPDYHMNVTVHPKIPSLEKCIVPLRSFHFFSRGASSDVAIWNRKKSGAEEEYARAVITNERYLDQSADRMHSACSYTEEEVTPLSKYQTEDLSGEIDKLYHKIINIQSSLPKEEVSADEGVSLSAGKVKEYLLGRVMAKPAFIALGLLFVLILLSLIPAVINCISGGGEHLITVIAAFAASAVLVLACGMAALIAQKAKLSSLIKNYNKYMKDAFNRLVDNADDYSAYMTSIASHAKGNSYLQIVRKKKYYTEAEHYARFRHIRAINIILSKLSSWSKAFGLDVDFISKRSEIWVDIDTSIEPLNNKAYMFDSEMEYDVAINNSGMSMVSPYCFARKIEIIREELYEDE